MHCYFSEVVPAFLVSAKQAVIICRLAQSVEDKITMAVRLLMSGSLDYCVITALVFLSIMWEAIVPFFLVLNMRLH